jgi:hypothetical protein
VSRVLRILAHFTPEISVSQRCRSRRVKNHQLKRWRRLAVALQVQFFSKIKIVSSRENKIVHQEFSACRKTLYTVVRADSTVGSPLLTLGPREVILADCKDYEEDGHVFQRFADSKSLDSRISTRNRRNFSSCRPIGQSRRFFCAGLLVTYVNKYTELATVDFSSTGIPSHSHLSKSDSEHFRA